MERRNPRAERVTSACSKLSGFARDTERERAREKERESRFAKQISVLDLILLFCSLSFDFAIHLGCVWKKERNWMEGRKLSEKKLNGKKLGGSVFFVGMFG